MTLTLTKMIVDKFMNRRNLNFRLINEKKNLYLQDNTNKCKINLIINRKKFYTSNKTNRYNKELILNLLEVKRSQLSGLKQHEIINLDYDMKRKHFIIDDFTITQNKRRFFRNSFNGYISASKVRNFLIEDPFLDYLKMFGPDKIIPNFKYEDDKFSQHILEKGLEFEEEIIECVKENFKTLSFKQICNSVEDVHDLRNFTKTIDSMNRGVDIIYQGLLVDKKNKYYGSPDLILKSTVLDDFFPEINYTKIGGCKFSEDYHYVICDIKGTTIHMNSDDVTMRNNGSMKAFKGQLYIYQMMLNQIQETQNMIAIIWAKNKRNDNNNFLYHTDDIEETFGIIDYGSKDSKYVDLVGKAISWLRELKKNGSEWELYPKPSHENLYPNMKNEMNGKYKKIKKKYANDIKEITMLYHCGVKRRKLAHQKNITSFDDKKLNSKVMGFKDSSKIGNIVNKIIEVNNSNNKIMPKKIKTDLFDWRTRYKLEIFIDFETLNSVVDGVDKTRIFMIGIGYEYKKKYYEKCFTMKQNTYQGEIEMFDRFYKHVEKLEEELECQAKYFHWYDAEPIFYRKFISRTKDLDFIDLEKVFRSEPICIKNCYNFKLKSVATAMYQHKMIKTCWDSDSACSDGRLAMILAGELYQKYPNNVQELMNNKIMRDIVRYNMIDVKVLYEILSYIRKNH